MFNDARNEAFLVSRVVFKVYLIAKKCGGCDNAYQVAVLGQIMRAIW
jgi:hypothetical protein